MNIEDICETGPTVYSPYPRRLERRHFLLSYFKILSVDPAGVRARHLPRDSPTLNQLSHRCAPERLDVNVNVNALFIVEVHLAIKLVYRHSTVNKVKVTIQT